MAKGKGTLAVVEGGAGPGGRGPKRDKRGTPYYDVHDSKSGTLLCRVGRYQDPIVNKPESMARFLDFLPVFLGEVEKGKWGGLALDSVSSTALSARKYHQYDLNEDAKDPRQWYGGGADITEEVLCLQLPSMPCHVAVALHVHREKIEAEGKLARQPFVPGKRMAESKSVAACYPELWRLFAVREGDKKVRRLQTDGDDRYIAGTCIGVPDDMQVFKSASKTWEVIWSGYRGTDRPLLHTAIYADPHVGKSTFMAGMAVWMKSVGAAPLYVALFDGIGKDLPYRLLGTVRE